MSAEDSPTYCKLAHVSLAVQNEGDVCVCNKNTQSFKDGKNNKLYLHEAGLERMWGSPTRRLMLAALDHGKRPISCQSCWDDEDAGIKSLRQSFNEKLADLKPLPSQPSILILKPTNTCNMSCRMCQPSTSTMLYQDYYQVEQQVNGYTGTFKDYIKRFETIRLGLGKQNDDIWSTFEQWLPALTVLDIYGGEPLLASAMWEKMIDVADRGQASEVSIQFHTNGTLWNDDYVRILPKFKHVQITVSIDSHIAEQLKYIRHRVDVDALYTNLARYIALSKEHSNISVNICFTVSVYNIWYADSILKELAKYGVMISTNIVYGPDQYDSRHLPAEIKNKLIQRFKDNPDCEKLVSLLNFVVPGCDVWWPRLWKEIRVLDQIRKQSFAEVFPDYYQELLPYIPNEPS